MPLPTLIDIAKANGSDAVAGLIDDAIKVHPELSSVFARTIRGISYKTLARTALGRTTGSFRTANAGSTPIKGTYENRTVETFILDARFKSDKAVADRYEDGAPAYIAIEAGGIMEGEMQGLASQFYYGSGNNASGPPGLIDSYDATNMAVDAGGTTATTGSSVWLVRDGPQAVGWVWGQNGSLNLSALREETGLDPNDTTKELTYYAQNLMAYPGIQVGSQQAVCRIKKLTADSGKGLTDVLLNQALAKFPVGRGPTQIFMSQRSAQQLQSSRTATNPTGQPAPWPNSIQGVDGSTIPIRVTEAIVNTESLTL